MNVKTISLISFCCAMLLGFSACKKDNSVAPNVPAETVKPGKAVWFISPKSGQTLIYGALTEFRWAENKDSLVDRVVIEYRHAEGGGEFKQLFEAEADSSVKRIKAVFDLKTLYEFRIRGKYSLSSDTCRKNFIDGFAFGIDWPAAGAAIEKANTVTMAISNGSGKNVAIDLSIDDGNHWKEIIPAGGEPKWLVKDGPAATCRLRLRTADTLLVFISDVFRIIQSPQMFSILLPSGNDVTFLSTVLISYVDSLRRRLSIDLSTDGGKSWNQLFNDQNPAVTGTKIWTVNQGPSDFCRLRMLNDETQRTFYSLPFKILNPNAPSRFAITNFKAGDVIDRGSLVPVSYVDSLGLSFRIDISTNNRVSWTKVFDIDGKLVTETKQWSVLQGPCDSCWFRMISNAHPEIVYVTPMFKITDKNLDKNFAITYPAAGDIVPIGSLVSIQTVNTAGLSTSIDYSIDNGATWYSAWFMDNKKWIVDFGPLDACYLRMKGGNFTVKSGPFKVVADGLVECTPLHVGQAFQYTNDRPQVISGESSILNITVTSVADKGSYYEWSCTLDHYDSSNVFISSSKGTIQEQKALPGRLQANFLPFWNAFPLYHYLNSAVTAYAYSIHPSCSERWYNCTVTQGRGITSMTYDYVHYGHPCQMTTIDECIYALQ